MATSYSYRDNLNDSSDEDSSDNDDIWKRSNKSKTQTPKITQRPLPTAAAINENNASKRRINNIWSDVALENDMTETIVGVGLNEIPEGAYDRSSESYDFTRKELDDRPYPEDEDIMDDDENQSKNGKYRHPERITLNGKEAKIAKKISWKLNERKKYLIERVVGVIGSEKALEFLKQTEEIEDSGGMLVKNSSRRRTPGGVYLSLIKSDPSISKEEIDKIFEGEHNNFALMKAKRKLIQEARKAFDIKGKNYSSHRKHKNRKYNKIKPRFHKPNAMETTDDEPLIPKSFFENTENSNDEERLPEEQICEQSSLAEHSNYEKNSDIEDGEITD